MTRDEIISLVQGRMTRTDNTTQAELEIKMAQIELERNAFLPWFLMSVNDSGVLSIDSEDEELVTGFLREIDEEQTGLWIIDSSSSPAQYKPLDKLSGYDELLAKYRYDEPAEPKAYYLDATLYKLRPIPDAAYSVRRRAYVADTVLTSDIENNWTLHAPDLVAARLGMLLTRYDVDKTIHDMFREDYNQAMARLQVQDEARRQAAMEAVMGEEDG